MPKNEIDETADVIRCSSEEDFDFVLDFVCDNGIARQALGDYCIAVPKGSADELMKLRPTLEIEAALSAAELDAEERAELRRENLTFVDGA